MDMEESQTIGGIEVLTKTEAAEELLPPDKPQQMPERQFAEELRFIDLHTHTSASDGSMSPSELVRYAKLKGLKAVAVTDHDTVDGLQEALDAGRRLDMEVIAGIEISVDFNPEMHMLGYFPKGGYIALSGILGELRKRREERNPKIVRRLNELGFSISMEEVESICQGEVVGRPHIARVMLEKGYVASIREAFDKYLASGRSAYFKKDKLTPEEGIAAIRNAGGLPVLAHPVHLNTGAPELEILLKRLSEAGLAGIEACYTDNSEEQTALFVRLAERYDLLVTGGSDFHGSYKPDVEIGTGRGNLAIPYVLLQRMKDRAVQQTQPD